MCCWTMQCAAGPCSVGPCDVLLDWLKLPLKTIFALLERNICLFASSSSVEAPLLWMFILVRLQSLKLISFSVTQQMLLVHFRHLCSQTAYLSAMPDSLRYCSQLSAALHVQKILANRDNLVHTLHFGNFTSVNTPHTSIKLIEIWCGYISSKSIWIQFMKSTLNASYCTNVTLSQLSAPLPKRACCYAFSGAATLQGKWPDVKCETARQTCYKPSGKVSSA